MLAQKALRGGNTEAGLAVFADDYIAALKLVGTADTMDDALSVMPAKRTPVEPDDGATIVINRRTAAEYGNVDAVYELRRLAEENPDVVYMLGKISEAGNIDAKRALKELNIAKMAEKAKTDSRVFDAFGYLVKAGNEAAITALVNAANFDHRLILRVKEDVLYERNRQNIIVLSRMMEAGSEEATSALHELVVAENREAWLAIRNLAWRTKSMAMVKALLKSYIARLFSRLKTRLWQFKQRCFGDE